MPIEVVKLDFFAVKFELDFFWIPFFFNLRFVAFHLFFDIGNFFFHIETREDWCSFFYNFQTCWELNNC